MRLIKYEKYHLEAKKDKRLEVLFCWKYQKSDGIEQNKYVV